MLFRDAHSWRKEVLIQKVKEHVEGLPK